MADDMSFDEDKNAWLLTLPEFTSGRQCIPACTIVVTRTLKDTYFPGNGDKDGKQHLSGRMCTLSVSWGGGLQQQTKYIAKYRVNIWNGKSALDLTNINFLLESHLRGRGLGSWIMQQLICWAKTLPEDTPVKRIMTSPVDEKEKDNVLRRDRFWHGIGFRFEENRHCSQPLHIRDLQLPQGRYRPLQAVPLHQGVAELAATCEQQKRDLRYLELARTHQADMIRSLAERQWYVLPMKWLVYVLFAVSSPVLLAQWLYGKVVKNKTDGQA